MMLLMESRLGRQVHSVQAQLGLDAETPADRISSNAVTLRLKPVHQALSHQ